jgi:hypothetical protein
MYYSTAAAAAGLVSKGLMRSIENAFPSLGPWMKYYTWCVGGLCISRTFGINQDGISQGLCLFLNMFICARGELFFLAAWEVYEVMGRGKPQCTHARGAVCSL